MTSDVADMSTPVTRGELRDELAQLEIRIDDKLERLERKLDNKLERSERKLDDKLERLEHKLDNNLGLWGAALGAQISELAVQIRKAEERLLNELARHTQAVFESMTKAVSAVDEKYNDLPARVNRLEAEMDALK